VYAVVVTSVGVTTAGSYVTVASIEMTPSAGLTEIGTTASPPGGTNSGDGTLTTLVARAGTADAQTRIKKRSIADVFTIFMGEPFDSAGMGLLALPATVSLPR